LIETQEVKAPAVRKTPTVVAGKVAKKAEWEVKKSTAVVGKPVVKKKTVKKISE
jgi:hypothetical protein